MDVVLVRPEIPQNTGSIARTCAATKTPLHIIKPTKFEISDRTVRRAGLDYWPYVSLLQHESWNEYVEQKKTWGTVWCLTKFAERAYWDAEFGEDDSFIFGSESKGLGQEFTSQFPSSQLLKIPMACPEVRSLNLSNCVSIVLFEALRQRELNR